MASPALGKQSSAKEAREPAASTVSTGASAAIRHWGTLSSNVLDELHSGLITTDLNGHITGGNSAVLEIYGYVPQDLLGQHLSLLCPEEGQGPLRDSMLGTVLRNGRFQGELRTRKKSGEAVYIQLSLSTLHGDDSSPVGLAGVFIDVTEQKLLDLAMKLGQEKHSRSSDSTKHAQQLPSGIVQRTIDETQFVIASPVMHKFMAMVDRVARHSEIVLITGETGSGKELIARSIHDNSSRHSQPFVDINCAALPEQLVESELFGYEKGAFSGADSSKPGLFELANRGTLFLDEIGELDLKLQVKLLRVLDSSPYYRLGGHRKITVDVRVVAATNQDLAAAVHEGRFRRDLYHRLSQLQLCVPPLRERPEDIVALAQHFLGLKDSKLRFSPEALSSLACYSWPGNVRELRNLVAKLAMAEDDSEISVDDLLAEISVEPGKRSEHCLPVTDLEGMEEQMIIKALESTGGRRNLAAEQLGISRRTLSRKLREYNITCPDGDKGRALGTMGQDQQKFFRAKAQFLVRLRNRNSEEIDVTAVNLSTGGLGVDGLTDPQRHRGLLDASFLLPGTETLIQAKVRVVWADASGRAGIRFVVLEPALFQEIHHWTARKAKEEGWELQQR